MGQFWNRLHDNLAELVEVFRAAGDLHQAA